MKKLTVTYHAKGNNRVVEVAGHPLFDGKSEEIEVSDVVAEMLSNNPFFECSKATDVAEKHETKETEKHKGR